MSRKKSDLYHLMARKETAQRAGILSETARLTQAHLQAEMLNEKLRELLNDRMPKGVLLAADLRSNQVLTSKIATEATKSREKVEKLAQDLAEARGELAKREHKKRILEDAALAAKRDEAEDAEKRAASAAPQIRRR